MRQSHRAVNRTVSYRVPRTETADGTDAEIAEVEPLGVGFALHWEKRDVDVSLGRSMNGVFHAKAWMSELARHVGSVTSPAKAAAARANGAKGWRPRKMG